MRLDARSGRLAMAVGIVAGWVAAAPPAWWSNRGVLTTNAPNDFAPATAGQLKHIASKAKDELDYSLNDGAGTVVAARVASFLNTNNYAAINLGQIKQVAQPFYERINAQGVVTGYPWTVATTTDDMNFAAANLGQLKTVFSFDFDVDGDGMSDWWEMQQWTSLTNSGSGDSDNDGLLNSEEYVYRTNPNSNDSDGDGLWDGEEVRLMLAPKDPADANPRRPASFHITSDCGEIWFGNTKVGTNHLWGHLLNMEATTEPEAATGTLRGASCEFVYNKDWNPYGTAEDTYTTVYRDPATTSLVVQIDCVSNVAPGANRTYSGNLRLYRAVIDGWTNLPHGDGTTNYHIYNHGYTNRLYWETHLAAPGKILLIQVTYHVTDRRPFDVDIRAADGVSDPPRILPISSTAQLQAVISPPMAGAYNWTASGSRLTLLNNTSATVTVVVGSNASSSVGAESIRCDFTPHGATFACGTNITTTVLKVEIFRDEACTKVLDDWPADGTHPRSPKYLMKADSNIYVRVTTGQGLGDAFMIAVGTESSPDSATLMLHEVSPGVYRNTSADDSGLIRLGKEDALAPPSPHIHWFKTVDEELLTAKVRLVGTTTDICSKDVMVDRAEYGRAKGSPEDGDESTAWDTRLQNVKLAIDGNMNWADDGRAIGTTVASVQSAINDAVAGQCDFMFVLCHGGCGTDGSDYWYSMNYALYAPGQEPVGNSDEIRPADHWNQDVEWVWFDACEVLGVPPDEVDEIEDNDPNNDPDPWIGLHVWDDVLLNSPRQMHALMGYSWKVRTSGSEAIDDFFEALADGETVKQAYIDANVNYNIQGYDAPYVIIINQDNVADTGETITRDSTDPEVCVSWGDVDYLITVDEEEMAAYDPRPTVKSSESSPFGQGFPGRLYSGGGARLVLGDDALRTNRTHSIRSTDRASVLFRTDRPNQLSQLGRHQREAIEAESRRVFSELTGSTLPASAKCCSIMTMHEMTGVNPKDRANAKSRTVGRVVRFRNYIEGIPVEGDFIRIQTGESQTTTLAAKWHDVGNLRSLKPDDCVSATNAIADVTVHTGQQGPPKDLRYSRLVYMVNAEDELIPTWKFILKGQKVLTTPACRGPVK